MEHEHFTFVVRYLAATANLGQRDDNRVHASSYSKLERFQFWRRL